MIKTKNEYINREISWLHFNARVLQESKDPRVPLIDRLRFLGIFSNNLDEFFKVRYATVKRIVDAGKTGKSVLGGERAKDLLEEITKIVINQQTRSLEIFKQIDKELREKNIFIIRETEVNESQAEFIRDYFFKKVNQELMTIILNDLTEFPLLKDTAAYLAVKVVMKNGTARKKHNRYALIEIPKGIDRFVVLPKEGDKDYVIMLDDLIRFCLDSVFTMFDFESISAHVIPSVMITATRNHTIRAHNVHFFL